MVVNIQYVSDLHLEFRGTKYKNLFKISGDILCMAGDICACGNRRDFNNFTQFLRYICPKYKYVIHVAGNHEYYTAGESKIDEYCTMQAIDKKLKKIESDIPNYIYLNCKSITLTINDQKCIFIGATMWSYVEPAQHKIVQENMNDFVHIYMQKKTGPKKYTIDDMQSLHKKHVNFIGKAINEAQKKRHPCVLITHHKPIGDTPVNEADILTPAYETDITNIIKSGRESCVKLAIHGHTHRHYDKVISGTRYVSNPKGYVNQHTKFIDNIVFKI